MAETQVVLAKSGGAEPVVPPPPEEAPRAAAPKPVRRPSGRRPSRYTLRTIAVLYVAVLVLVPLGVIVYRTFDQGLGQFVDLFQDPAAVHAFTLTGEVAGLAVLINLVFGLGVSMLLARYRFPGRRLLDVLIDVPVSISPIIVGLALVLVYGNTTGWFGPVLRDIGFQVIFATPGMVLATAFVSLPLVVREVLPVLREIGTDQEVAARSLGANALQIFGRITFPAIRAALLYGVVLSIARSLGEFGAVRVVSGSIVGQTQTVTLLVEERAEQFEPGAYQASLLLIAVAVLAMVIVGVFQHRGQKKTRGDH
ncbi:sulfate ABC transporter permease subunit [Jatrophihabitans sp. YIM 134969]